MTQLMDNVWAIKVPGQVKDFMSFMEGVKNGDADTPDGKFQFLFTTATATEEDAKKAVESIPCGRKKIYKGVNDNGNEVWYESPLKSLASLLRSKNLDPQNNYALIEKLK